MQMFYPHSSDIHAGRVDKLQVRNANVSCLHKPFAACRARESQPHDPLIHLRQAVPPRNHLPAVHHVHHQGSYLRSPSWSSPRTHCRPGLRSRRRTLGRRDTTPRCALWHRWHLRQRPGTPPHAQLGPLRRLEDGGMINWKTTG